MEAIRLLDKGLNQSEVARRLKVVRQTVSRWVRESRSPQGKQALKKAGCAGRKPRLTEHNRERLQQLLLRGPEELGHDTPLWTCGRVAHLIQQEFGIGYHEGHVWKILVSLGWRPQRLGWSPQRPEGRARERNEEEVRRWRKKTWAATKKKPAHRGGRSSSSTKAD